MNTATPSPAGWAGMPVEIVARVETGWNKLVNDLPLILGRLATAAALILIGVLFLRLGRHIIRRIAKRAPKVGKENARSGKTLHTLFLSIFNYIMYFVIAMSALSAMGVDVSSLLTVAGVGGVAIGFGCQTLVKDVISGLFLWIDGQIHVGDVVTVAGQTGTVESIALRTTVLRSTNGSLYTVPNGDIRTVVNMSLDYRRAQVDITVSHGQDLPRILEALQDEMNLLGKRLEMAPQAPEVLGVIGSDRFSAIVRVECKCKVETVWALEREIRLAALDRMSREGMKP